jgi:type IV fimbrial biogenesis protein FimT
MSKFHAGARASQHPRLQDGLTLVEVITVIGIVAILAAAAFPSMTTMLVAQRLRSAGTDLVSSLLIARSEAIKRGRQVRLAPVTGKDWSAGWIANAIAADKEIGEQIDRRNAPGYRVQVTRAPATIVYERTGRLSAAGVTRIQLSDIAGDTGAPARCVTIDPSGLPRLAVGACS